MKLFRLLKEEEREIILKYKDTLSFAKADNYYGIKSLLDKGVLSEEDKEGYILISNILKDVVADFVSFSGFVNENTLRVQYRWSPLFTGIGLITLDELVHDFKVEGE